MVFETFKRWGLRGGLGILDQGLFSLINFILNIQLARNLSANAYGAFAATFSVFLLAAAVQTALIAEPMSILGVDKYNDRIVEYLDHLLWLQWLGSLGVAVVIVMVASFLRDSLLRENLTIMAFALPFMLLYWYLRRTLYLKAESGIAAIASISYFAIQLGAILFLLSRDQLSILNAYFVMLGSSLVVSVPMLRRTGLRFFGTRSLDKTLTYNFLGDEQWAIGKWLLMAYTANWITTLSYPLLITMLINYQFAGVFRGIFNLFLPVQQYLAVVTLLILPVLARKNRDQGKAAMFGFVRWTSILVTSTACIYCIIVIALRIQIVRFLYNSDLYTAYSELVPLVGLATLIGVIHLVPGLGLRVVRRTDYILWSKGTSVIFLVLVGLPLMRSYRIDGVLMSLIGGALVEALILILLYLKSEKNETLRSKEADV